MSLFIPVSRYRRYHPQYLVFGEMSLSLDHHLTATCKLVREWRTVQYLTTEIFKCLKFSTLNLVPWACKDENVQCADELLTMVTEGVVNSVNKVVTGLTFSVIWQHKASGGMNSHFATVSKGCI